VFIGSTLRNTAQQTSTSLAVGQQPKAAITRAMEPGESINAALHALVQTHIVALVHV